MAAISACHIPLGGLSLGKDPLVSRFLHGTLMLRPAARTSMPTWDLAIVLKGLFLAPFKPLEEVPATFFGWLVKAFLHPSPGYVPKVLANGNYAASILSSFFSECGPGKAQFALASAGIRCLCP